jgi:hypothetical protein
MTYEEKDHNPNAAVLDRLQLDTPTGIRLGHPRAVGALSLIPLFHEGATSA